MRTEGSRLVRLVALAGLLAPAGVVAQANSPWQSARQFGLYAENDALFGGSDSAYTNGIRLTWDFMMWNQQLRSVANAASLRFLAGKVFRELSEDVPFECTPLMGRADRPCGTVTFGLGQTMYTPSTIVDTLPRPDERPYAGFLFGSVAVNTFHPHWQVSSELLAGVIGPASGSEATQSLAHWTWSTNAAKPRGWRNQLRNSLQVTLVNTWAWRFPLEWCHRDPACNGSYGEGRRFDITPRAELVTGTHMRRASLGGIVRAGINFPDAIGLARIPTTAPAVTTDRPSHWWVVAFLSGDTRHVFHNALLTGSTADNGDQGWRDIMQIDPERRVNEWSWGGSIGFRLASVTLSINNRSREYGGDTGWHRFGSLAFSLFTPGQ